MSTHIPKNGSGCLTRQLVSGLSLRVRAASASMARRPWQIPTSLVRVSWPVSGEPASIMVYKLSEVRSGTETEKCSAEQASSFRYFVLVGGRRAQVGAPFAEDRDCGDWSKDQNRSAEQVRQGS